jgi:hypothetical protein
MLETTRQALYLRGLKADLFTLEKKGIPKTLASLGVEWEELGLKGCRLFYRRRDVDMPLVPMADRPSPQQMEQAEKVRRKLLANARSKYLFRFEPCRIPVDKIVEDGRLAGLVFKKTRVKKGRAEIIEGTDQEVRSPLTISSIGSIPEPIPGLQLEWELFPIESEKNGKLKGYDNVFALGNAVTGRGNIRASRLHARQVIEWLAKEFLNWDKEDSDELRNYLDLGDYARLEQLARDRNLPPADQVEEILGRVSLYQKRSGYENLYPDWIRKNRPARLEDINE